jgi:hypothetical protein
MMNESDLAANIEFDNRLDAYRPFFDHEWVKEFDALSVQSRVNPAAFSLILDWKGIGLVHRMPWLMIVSYKGLYEGFSETNPDFWQRLTQKFGEYVLQESKLSNMRKKELMEAVHRLGNQVEGEMVKAVSPLEPQVVWEKYLSMHEFPWSLWNSQKMAYAGLYYAYENFVQHVVGIGKRDDDYRAKRFDDLKKDFGSFFVDKDTEFCLTNDELDTIRLVRNSLTHDGGRLSSKLKNKKHGVRVSDGRLSIFPEDVKGLFDFLKVRASRIAILAKENPSFK